MMTVMIRVNEFDKIFLDAQRQGRISFYMTSRGEEATWPRGLAYDDAGRAGGASPCRAKAPATAVLDGGRRRGGAALEAGRELGARGGGCT